MDKPKVDPTDLRLTPTTKEPPHVPISLPEMVVTDEEALEALQAMGLTRVPEAIFSKLARLGVHLDGHGTIRIQRGQALIGQRRVDMAQQILLQFLIQKSEEKKVSAATLRDIAHTIGYLQDRMTKSQEYVTRTARGIPNSELPPAEPPMSKSFAPGSTVIYGQGAQVIVNPPAPKPEPKPTIEIPPAEPAPQN